MENPPSIVSPRGRFSPQSHEFSKESAWSPLRASLDIEERRDAPQLGRTTPRTRSPITRCPQCGRQIHVESESPLIDVACGHCEAEALELAMGPSADPHWRTVRNRNMALAGFTAVISALLMSSAMIALGTRNRSDVSPAPSSKLEFPLHTVTFARTWQEWLPLVRHASDLEETMSAYYAANTFFNLQHYRLTNQWPLSADHRWWQLQLTSPNGDSTRAMTVEVTPDGPRFDWEDLVDCPQWQWRQFQANKPREASPLHIHAILSPFTSDRLPHSSEQLVRSGSQFFKVYHHHYPEALLAKVDQSPQISSRLAELLEWDRALRLTVEARWNPDGYVEITDVIQLGWIRSKSEIRYDFPFGFKPDGQTEPLLRLPRAAHPPAEAWLGDA